ncbi:MAG: DNA mismatch repair endonuclease MutL [Clostridiales bacterium]|nr:DNA mismatch repair endonuclease MutL [Clostridiales bacterium]
MPKIQCLDAHIADLIAAGEVVERPASVVKELTENAIDAGAANVTVEIQRGGMSYIRVTDDGCGIAAAEAETAFLRHATSKIRTEYDLEAIGTLGFRGEALAAIAAVSKVELMTKTADEPFGTALLLDGGVVRERSEVGCPDGTTMIVRELFYNTPARLKFIKRDTAEGAAVTAVVQHAAMSHPEVAFRLIREGKQELATPGDGSLKSAVYAVLGRDVALGFLPCRSDGDIAVEGFVSRPVCCRGTRGCQHFFVNGRYVKSRTMTAALEEAYKNQKMVGKFPCCVLHLTTKLSSVDVNVHPTKTEVKFSSEKALFDAVYYAVKSALQREQGHPDALPEQPPAKPQKADTVTGSQTFFQTMTAEEYRRLGLRQPKAADLRDSGRLYQPQPEPRKEEPAPSAPSPVRETAPLTARPAAVRQVSPVEPDLTVVYDEPEDFDAPPAKPEPAAEPAPPRREAPEPPIEDMPQEPPTEAAPSAPEEPLPQPEPLTPDAPLWRIAGEVLHTYIIVEQGDTVYLIDKHAAHERMNFDRLKARDYQPMCQLLLTPLVYKPEPDEYAALTEHLPLLAQFGFEVEEFGGGTLLVRQVPDYLAEEDIFPSLGELAERLLTTGTADPSAARDELLHTMACKSAIKGGWVSGERELEVVAEAVMSGRVKYCPHGRPVAITMTKKQIEKQFKRIV